MIDFGAKWAHGTKGLIAPIPENDFDHIEYKNLRVFFRPVTKPELYTLRIKPAMLERDGQSKVVFAIPPAPTNWLMQICGTEAQEGKYSHFILEVDILLEDLSQRDWTQKFTRYGKVNYHFLVPPSSVNPVQGQSLTSQKLELEAHIKAQVKAASKLPKRSCGIQRTQSLGVSRPEYSFYASFCCFLLLGYCMKLVKRKRAGTEGNGGATKRRNKGLEKDFF